jgi:hypothetical protein
MGVGDCSMQQRKSVVNYRAAHGVLDILSIIVRNVKFY